MQTDSARPGRCPCIKNACACRTWPRRYQVLAHPPPLRRLLFCVAVRAHDLCGQTRNKLLEQWVHLTNHTAGALEARYYASSCLERSLCVTSIFGIRYLVFAIATAPIACTSARRQLARVDVRRRAHRAASFPESRDTPSAPAARRTGECGCEVLIVPGTGVYTTYTRTGLNAGQCQMNHTIIPPRPEMNGILARKLLQDRAHM